MLFLVQLSDASETSLVEPAKPKSRPISEVINLLEDMLASMKDDESEDQKVYDKMACWCETNDNKIAKEIKEFGEELDKLMVLLSQLIGESTGMGYDVDKLRSDLEREKTALQTAHDLRQRRLEEFREGEKDMLQSIQAIKQAIIVLSKHHPDSDAFMQTDPEVKHVLSIVQGVMDKYSHQLKGVFTRSERRSLSSLLQTSQPSNSALTKFLQNPFNSGSYTAQSKNVMGLLKEMLDQFETNYAEMVKEEQDRAQAFVELRKAKLEEIDELQTQLGYKSAEKAAEDEKIAENTEDKEIIVGVIEGDQAYMDNVKAKCYSMAMKYLTRKQDREDEMASVQGALAVLSKEDAHDLFTRTYNPSFFQRQAVRKSARVEEAVKMLQKAAAKSNSSQLLHLASRLRLDPFSQIKDSIYAMMKELKTEAKEEKKFKDECNDEFHENKLGRQDNTRRKAVAVADVRDLKQQIVQLDLELQTLNSDVATIRHEMQVAGETRDESARKFRKAVDDQRATVKLLTEALEVLKSFYNKAKIKEDDIAAANEAKEEAQEAAEQAQLLQVHGNRTRGNRTRFNHTQPKGFMPSGFRRFRQQSTNVLYLIQRIIDKTEQLEVESTRDEQEEQTAYGIFVEKSNNAIKKKEDAITKQTQFRAKKNRDLIDAETERDENQNGLNELEYQNTDLHRECDFVLNNWDKRVKARDDELEGLSNAMGILAGANYDADFLHDKEEQALAR